MDILEPVVVILALALLLEAALEAAAPLLEPIFERLPLPEDVNLHLWLATLLAIGLVFTWDVNVLDSIGLEAPDVPAEILTKVLSGLVIGRGSNFVHDLIETIAARKEQVRAAAETLSNDT